MIVLDTNVISELQGRKYTETILLWLDRYDIGTVYLTSIATAEMHFGLALLDHGRRRDALMQTFAKIEYEFRDRTIGFTIRAAAIYGRISAQRQKAGRPL